ncbi:MAG: hypothetical protein HN382_02785 [Gammaproteobacteria bacterium]|nr:hypothetical protein [Gammaproteobacteria bacterium]MBT4607229.1 hypothetical protein [Thiotrichales bacterium]MBT3472805.1 hypothetical protein [Gammaproteobacteria bacterium]MBT4080049.1 hypothetical protein [Gammaproteobacteria bacterium]MBT4330899.1 hypothetical protein [Gammaproteobacteria bacterium]
MGTLIDQLFQGYFSLERSGGQLLESRYDPLLVTLSYLIAVFAVYTTIGLVAHMRREFEAGRQKNRYWWAGAALTLGGGIFVMHFVAMLAFSIQVEVRYDLGMTLLSLLVAVVGSAVALMQIRGRLSFPRLIWGGVWMGGGVAAMHYVGMASLQAPALLRYAPGLWLISVLVAVVVSMVTMVLFYYFSSIKGRI